ncbi:MAG TPA: hypothetical protein VFW63_08100, partial [Acidimicrobiales bacterium]|nr:hypothetical protein [Acidimicrobiales bacterium]
MDGHPRVARFAPPTVPRSAVVRHRLLSLLDSSPGHRLTVVVAPAGYGKTVLLSQWAAARPRRRLRWLTLDPGDDPGRLALRLGAALEASAAGGGGGLPRSGPRDDRSVLTALRASIERAPPTTVVLDDLHRSPDRSLVEVLGPLLAELPPGIHFALATRVDPPLPYHRLLLSDAVVEVRQEDLAFRSDEAAQLVRGLPGRDLPAPVVDGLVAGSGGWAVGLRAAAGSLCRRAAGEPAGAPAPGGAGRAAAHVADQAAADLSEEAAAYLSEEVLDRQPDATRRFLLSTSVLDHLSGPLCDFVTRRGGGQATLDALERGSVFTARLAGRPGELAYHPMFRALLRQRLRAEDPGLEQRLLRRAGRWHLARGHLDAAVGHLADGRSWEEVLTVAATHGSAAFARGRPADVVGWIDRVPRSAWGGKVPVLLLRATAAVLAGEPEVARDSLDAVDARAAVPPSGRVVADLLRSRSDLELGSLDGALAAARRALAGVRTLGEPLPPGLGVVAGPADVEAAAGHALGVAQWHQGDPAARHALEDVLGRGGHPLWEVLALGSLALLDAWAGRLARGERWGRRALALAGEVELGQRPAVAEAHLALAHVARERDRLDEAATALGEAALAAGGARRPVLDALVETERAMLARAVGGPGPCREAATPHRAAGRPPSPLPRAVLARRGAVEARLSLAVGDLGSARRALDAVPLDGPEVAAARVHLAVESGDLGAAEASMARWPAGTGPHAGRERLLWRAVLDHLAGDDAAARQALATVVAGAEAEADLGLFRTVGHHALGPVRGLYHEAPTAFLRT